MSFPVFSSVGFNQTLKLGSCLIACLIEGLSDIREIQSIQEVLYGQLALPSSYFCENPGSLCILHNVRILVHQIVIVKGM